MYDKENTKAERVIETRPGRNWNGWDMFFIVAPILCIILVPLGGLFYISGRYNPYIFYVIAMTLPFYLIPLVIVCFVYSAIRLFSSRKKKDRKKIIIRIAHIGISLVFIILFVGPFFIPDDSNLRWSGHKFLVHGLRERVRSQGDIESIRDWLKTLSQEDCNGEAIRILSGSRPMMSQWPESVQWPQSLKVFDPRYIELSMDEDENPKVRLTWGGTFGYWGVEIGMGDMEIPPSDFSQYGEYRLAVEPGVYVWRFWPEGR